MTEERRYEPDIVEQSVIALPLGYIDDNGNLALGAHPGGTLHGFRLQPEYRELLERHDVTRDVSSLPSDDRAYFWALANAGIVALIRTAIPSDILELTPVARHRTEIAAELEDGYRFAVEGGGDFEATELASRFIPFIDSRRSFGEIAELVRREVLADPVGRASIAQAEAAEARSFDDFLCEDALGLAQAVHASGAATFERLD